MEPTNYRVKESKIFIFSGRELYTSGRISYEQINLLMMWDRPDIVEGLLSKYLENIVRTTLLNTKTLTLRLRRTTFGVLKISKYHYEL